jgi:putative flippase GtrA
MLLSHLEKNPHASIFGTRSNSNNSVPYSRIYFYGGLLVTKIYNVLFGSKLSDIATCYKVFSVRHVPALLSSSHDDFVFDAVDLTHTLVKAGPVIEVPISYTARSKKTGKKMNWKHGLDILIAILLVRLGVPSHRTSSAGKVVRFLVAGGTATIVNLAILYVLTDIVGIWYLVSSALAFTLSFFVSFTMQKYWAFRNKDIEKVRSQLPMHLSLALINLVVDVVLVYVFVDIFGMWYLFAQILAAAVISLESFFAFRWIYR